MIPLETLLAVARPYYENGDPSHDYSHVLRVVRMCERFGQELGARLELLLPAAALHDVVNVPKDSPDRMKASALAAQQAGKILVTLGLNETQCAEIGQIILEHSFSRGLKPSTLESAILQDADKLDGMGAIGIMRCATTGTRMGSVYYQLDDPEARGRPLDDRRFMLDHLPAKLLKLESMMNTPPGKREAARRARFLALFREEFLKDVAL